MTLPDDTLVVKGGEMNRRSLRANIDAVYRAYERLGTCVMVLLDEGRTLGDDRLVPHGTICLSTPELLAESGVEPALEATNDLGDRYQYTLWLPDDDVDTLIERLWSAFRGPLPKGQTHDDWKTDDLRRLHHPGS